MRKPHWEIASAGAGKVFEFFSRYVGRWPEEHKPLGIMEQNSLMRRLALQLKYLPEVTEEEFLKVAFAIPLQSQEITHEVNHSQFSTRSGCRPVA